MTIDTDFQAFQTKTAEAVTDVFGKSAKHFQTLAQDNADFARRSFEQATAAFGEIVKAPSIDKAAEIQRAYLKSAFDDLFQHVTSVSERQVAFAQEFAVVPAWSETSPRT